MAAYGGGGYTADLVHDQKFSRETLNYLKKDNWIDSQTRALFVEITMYNAQVNLFTTMNLLVEVLPTGGLQHFSSVRIARLYTYGGSAESFTIACQFFVIVFSAIIIYRESKKIYRERRAYFSGFWNLLEFVLMMLTLSALGLFVRRMRLVDVAVAEIRDNPGKFVSFNKVVQWDTMFSAVSSIVVFLSCLKCLRLLRYNKTISILSSTLQGCAKPLGAFSIIFLIFFMAFSIFAYILFMPHLDNFSTFVTTMESVMALLLGDFNFAALESTKPILGRFWFCLLMLFGTMYIMNVFLAIIMDTYSQVTQDIAMQNQDHEIVEFMVNKFMIVFGRGDGGQKALLASIDEQDRLKRQRSVEEKERHEAARQKKKAKRIPSFYEKSEYFSRLDEEIEAKFSQLDDSLDDLWMDGSEQQHNQQQQQQQQHYNYHNQQQHQQQQRHDYKHQQPQHHQPQPRYHQQLLQPQHKPWMRPDDQATVFGTPMQTKTQASASSTGKMKLPKLIQHSFENKAFVGDYEDERNEILMQRDLQEELEKWY